MIRLRRSKYRNVRTRYNGFSFDSRMEMARYQELCLLEKANKISGLEVHRRFPLEINGTHICSYESDFTYWVKLDKGVRYVVEDVKGAKTEVYKLKKKLMRAILGLDIVETRPR